MRNRDRFGPAGRRTPPFRFAVLLPVAIALSLAACGGGGGGGGGLGRGGGSPGPGNPGNPGSGDACVPAGLLGCLASRHRKKAGFVNQWGLGKVGAEWAWARLEVKEGRGAAPGSGRTVGLIDSGIDKGHPAFAGKTVTETFLGGATDDGDSGGQHGTAVAGVIAGRPNAAFIGANAAALGVAWGADIAMFAIPIASDGGGASTADYVPVTLTHLAASASAWKGFVDAATGWSSGGRTLDFVNASVGSNGIVDLYSEAELRANFSTAIAAMAQAGASEKTVFVWAAGNAHGDPCKSSDFTKDPSLCVNDKVVEKWKVVAKSPEVLAGLPARISELRGHTLAVAAVGSDGAIASFSNRCGIAAEWCLAAPGVGIRTAFTERPCLLPLEHVTCRGAYSPSGTSFAAPMVTGALAVMQHYFRDQLSNTALVTRLLETADNTGIYADSAVYGHGLLDLDAATKPVGSSSLALGDRVGGPASPAAQTRLALGSAFGNGPALSLAGREVAAFDELGAPFWYRLGDFVPAAPRVSAFARLDAFMAPEAWRPRAAAAPGGLGLTGVPSTVAGNPGRAVPPLLGGFAPGGRIAGWEGLRLGFVDAPAPAPGGGHLSLAAKALAFEAEGPGGLGFAAFSTEGMQGRTPVSGALLSWRSRERPLALRAGLLGERETMLGSRSAGAFGRLSAGSAFVGVDGGIQAGAWRLDASAEAGIAHAAADGGMLTGLSPLFSSAFALRAERPLDATGSLRLSVSQPLRVESGRARFSIPAGRTKGGRVLRRTLNASLAPSGRQIDFAAGWRKRLDAGGDLRLGAVWTLDPGHDPSAPAELTLLAGYRHSF